MNYIRKKSSAKSSRPVTNASVNSTAITNSSTHLRRPSGPLTVWPGGFVVDCPQRERLGYGGDGNATINMAIGNHDLAAFTTSG